MLFFVLLGIGMVLVGAVLLYVGQIFHATGLLLQKAGGDIEPNKGLTAARWGVALIVVGAVVIYITMKQQDRPPLKPASPAVKDLLKPEPPE